MFTSGFSCWTGFLSFFWKKGHLSGSNATFRLENIFPDFAHTISYEKTIIPSGFSQTLCTGAESYIVSNRAGDFLLLCGFHRGLFLGSAPFSGKRRSVLQPWLSIWPMAPGLWGWCCPVFLSHAVSAKISLARLSLFHASWHGTWTRHWLAARYILASELLGLLRLFCELPRLYLPCLSRRLRDCRDSLDLPACAAFGKIP